MVLAFYGASGLGSEFNVLAQTINEQENRWTEIIFVDDTPEKDGTEFVGLKVMNFTRAIETYGKENLEFIISIGEPAVKEIIYKKLKENGCTLANLIHPEAIIDATAKIGEGNVINRFSGAPPMSELGNNILIQGLSAIGHNVIIGDNVVVSSFAFIGGDTKIGRNTYIAPHSAIRNGINIGENAIVGMGAVVTKDVPDNAVVVGNPARILRYNEKSRVFSK